MKSLIRNWSIYLLFQLAFNSLHSNPIDSSVKKKEIISVGVGTAIGLILPKPLGLSMYNKLYSGPHSISINLPIKKNYICINGFVFSQQAMEKDLDKIKYGENAYLFFVNIGVDYLKTFNFTKSKASLFVGINGRFGQQKVFLYRTSSWEYFGAIYDVHSPGIGSGGAYKYMLNKYLYLEGRFGFYYYPLKPYLTSPWLASSVQEVKPNKHILIGQLNLGFVFGKKGKVI